MARLQSLRCSMKCSDASATNADFAPPCATTLTESPTPLNAQRPTPLRSTNSWLKWENKVANTHSWNALPMPFSKSALADLHLRELCLPISPATTSIITKRGKLTEIPKLLSLKMPRTRSSISMTPLRNIWQMPQKVPSAPSGKIKNQIF